MKILIIGSGGREHALAWKAAQSAFTSQVMVAPGNAGTAREEKVRNVPIGVGDTERLLAFAREEKIDLTIVGPEAPLVDGITDTFTSAGLRCFGPTKNAARLEGSKVFTKEFLARHGIPSAGFRDFTDIREAERHIREHFDPEAPIVIKADGLAAGKGVIVASNADEAIMAARGMLSDHAFGDAGRRIMVEEYLTGEEASFIALVDGEHILPMASSQDHKPRDEGDKGPNTGGMGAYSPAPVVTGEMHERILREIIEPTVQGMAAEGCPYRGFLYAGLMIGADGALNVLEYNCRFGDPETQPILMRLNSDLVELCEAGMEGTLDRCSARWDPRAGLGVVLASKGYPDSYPTGEVIRGLEEEHPHTRVFHAGTKEVEGNIVTAGGRVLCVCGLGDTVTQAQTAAYERVRGIRWENLYYRKDIGFRAVQRES
uniref:Phosphoribosylamine--glycine ligase n=1 Tax=Candidatus Kentrum sp. MB TaxID=2138164 RepID=A0A450XWM7_9GAMM|nr:MAG: phosphoribosylamine--glycine ligase [Candidatus Kentron sp. MB]VFK33680.1 MAG: phosphoribosylamine--glycine ligase [Candidatus Kentron sp. MB]VFK76298.1 MAG: phosphoribosylamine--glycine ligase [Candidatus Kentron sp. MB]